MSRLGLLGLFALALWLRLWGLAQGYPDFYGHVDEIGVAASIWNFFRAATLLPTEFTYPAFYSYMVAAALWATHAVGWGPELGGTLETLVLVSYTDPARAALVGRILSAVCSALVPVVTCILGRRAFAPRVGWIAGALATVAVVPVIQAHHALPDSAMALWAVLCFYFAWHIYQRGKIVDYVLAGIMAGLVVATKYNGAFAALAIPAAHWLRSGRALRDLVAPRLWLAVGLALVTLGLASPYLLLAHDKYLALASYQVSSLDFTMREHTPWWGILSSLPAAEGPVGVLVFGGMAWSLYRRRPLDWILWAAWLPSILYIGTWTRESLHYLLLFYPFWLLGAARLVDAGVMRFGGGRAWAVYALAGLCAVPGVYRIVEGNRQLQQPDLRQQAAGWIAANIPEGSRLGMSWLPYCPRVPLVRARSGIVEYYRDDPRALALLRQAWMDAPAYEVVNLEVWLKQPVVPEFYRGRVDLEDPETRRVFSRGWLSPSQLRQRGVEFVVLPEAAFGRFIRGEAPDTSHAAAHYHFVKNQAYFLHLIDPANPETERVARFDAPAEIRGAPISIYRLH